MSYSVLNTDATALTTDSTAFTTDAFDQEIVEFSAAPEVEARIDLVGTQYRESPNMLGLFRGYLDQVREAMEVIQSLPDFFDINTAVGEQLTFLGRRLGWPRCHCVCDIQPVFGFNCPPGDPNYNPFVTVVGFCEPGTWINCHEVGLSEYCIYDDPTYRRFLLARRYQMLGLFDLISLRNALRHIWGANANVVTAGSGRVVVAPNRSLTAPELRELPLAIRVLPIAPGIRATVHLGVGPNLFGFGEGWGGFCDNSEWLCETDPHAYDCAA